MSTTNSAELFSNESRSVEELLMEFLNGTRSLEFLQASLSKYITFDFRNAPARREITKNMIEGKIHIPVESSCVQNMLAKYIKGSLSADELSNWAAFIFLSNIFVPCGDTEEERWSAGEGPVWDILQRLMTPSVFGGLDQAVAGDYLTLLSNTTTAY